jgi:predicted RND superfamily exporter protein
MTATLVLSFNSFGLAALIGTVALFAVGLAALALKLFGSLFGFTAILGTLGLIGLAINDSIVVLAAIREDTDARRGNPQATETVVFHATRHVLATTVTTISGFVPLMLDKTGFWPPLAIAIAGGLGGATLLALYYIPSMYLLIARWQTRGKRKRLPPESTTAHQPELMEADRIEANLELISNNVAKNTEAIEKLSADVARWDERFFQLSRDNLTIARTIIITAGTVVILSPVLQAFAPAIETVVTRLLGLDS